VISLVLLRFHLRSGGRVAGRMLTPFVGATVAAAVLYDTPTAILAPPAALLFPPGVFLSSGILAAVLAVGTSKALAPRLTRGLLGWNRHLPAAAVEQRRAATAGLAMAQMPVMVVVALAGVLAAVDDPATSVPRLLGMPVLIWSGALAGLSVRCPARLLASVAAAVSFTGSALGLVAAVLVAGVAEATAGGLVDRRAVSGSVRNPLRVNGPIALLALITLRAMGWRPMAHLMTAPLVMMPLALFLANNALDSTQRLLAVRMAGLLASGVVMLACAEALARRRPPWPWVRSLPIAAARRVAFDALLLLAVGAPVILGYGLFEVAALASMGAAAPLLAVLGAKAVRARPDSLGGVSGEFLAEVFLVAAAISLLPFSWMLTIGLTPFAFRSAVSADRAQDVSQWHELHHLAVGDTESWSDR
jgi:hypothetical protein